MAANKSQQQEFDRPVEAMRAALGVLNAGEPDAVVRAVKWLYSMRQALPARQSVADGAASIAQAIEQGGAWVDAARTWNKLSAKRKGAVMAEVAEALKDVQPDIGYWYDSKRDVVSLVDAEPTAPPHALMALALLPLFDEGGEYWRRRLGICRYHRCGGYFVYRGKLGTKYCNKKHSNLERQIASRKRDKERRQVNSGVLHER